MAWAAVVPWLPDFFAVQSTKDMDGDAVPDGVIACIKPACDGDESREIYEYF
jgi:hypothetical protein